MAETMIKAACHNWYCTNVPSRFARAVLYQRPPGNVSADDWRELHGAFGLSMGATKAWWLAALDPRVKLCVDLCCMTDFDELIKANNLKGHGIYYYVPSLLKHFTTAQINELIIPRAHLSLSGRKDSLTPPAGVERVRDHLAPLYAKYGRGEDCRVELFDCGHEELPEMRRLTLEWMDQHLVNA